jgi:hypothetical protein
LRIDEGEENHFAERGREEGRPEDVQRFHHDACLLLVRIAGWAGTAETGGAYGERSLRWNSGFDFA